MERQKKKVMERGHKPGTPSFNSDGAYPFMLEADLIKGNIISLIDDIMDGALGDVDKLQSDNKRMDKISLFLYGWIERYLKVGRRLPDKQGNFKFRQICLAEKNIVLVLLALAYLLNGLEQYRSLQLIIN